ncbi:hypothetical protein B0H15DRAFT_831926 [Mycena belliarum]|uniref:F-box domain-containing protein n=1 Tax=Mycena belliarum TaxID=1033014 RepID=A0AAD6U6X6_9AGAR|nr:hypothetical protein B0H15DRAFT_831926 [Mycena belliae]
MSTAARDTVLATPELLALVLARLPMRDLLLRAPLVCKTWHATTLSPDLQRALFFAPDPRPLSDSTSDSASESSSSEPPPVRNPLLAELFPPFFVPRPPTRFDWPAARALTALPAASAPAAFARPDASWRRMLVAQPPPRAVYVVQKCQRDERYSEVAMRVALLRGLELRMGALYDLAARLANRDESWFCVTWNEEGGRKYDVMLETVLYTALLSEEICWCGEGPRPPFAAWFRAGPVGEAGYPVLVPDDLRTFVLSA